MPHDPTPEQSSIVEAATLTTNNLMLNALAGCGKSATLKLIDQAIKTKPALYLVFNKRNSDEALAAQKVGEFASTTTIRTFNSLGHRIWAASCANSVVLDRTKIRNLWREHIDTLTRGEAGAAWSQYQVVMDGIEKARALGYVPADVFPNARRLISLTDLSRAMDEPPNDHAIDLIDTILTESIKRAYKGHIDFNDQIYMPALFGGTFPRFPLVMVDEYQDLSPVNHAMLGKLACGRIIGVGDPWQNIYGFRGAASGGMAGAVRRYEMTEFPLSVSFRCPRAIVEASHWHVPHFRWIKDGGNVSTPETFNHSSFMDDHTIICRNNAPLLRLAFKLISAGRSVTVIGSELGPRLVNIMKKLGDASINRSATVAEIESWRQERVLAGSKSANDLADCMRVFAEHGDTLGAAISYAEHIFAAKGTIRLLTGHKSKGLEFDNVIHLDPWLIGDEAQERNLRYVVTTRSQNSLTVLDSDTIRW